MAGVEEVFKKKSTSTLYFFRVLSKNVYVYRESYTFLKNSSRESTRDGGGSSTSGISITMMIISGWIL